MKRLQRGQSTLEYVIILAAVIGGIIVIGTMLRGRMQTSYTGLGDKMVTKTAEVKF